MSDEKHFHITWDDYGREPQCESNPAFPEGVDVVAPDLWPGRASCLVPLPYPAKRCGAYHLRCRVCGLTVALTTAGRPDDPRSVRLVCQARQKSPPGPFTVN